ncbi:MAG: hypothetical protein J6U68_02140 [Clostridia bacterium]|nr:hypothetical protein [Clostridia bacterium]
MNVSFLSIEEDDMSLIGYELKLSPAEKSFLLEIINKDGATIDDLLSLLPDEVSRGNVAVRINSINKKALSLSGRKLILFENDKYIINPNL